MAKVKHIGLLKFKSGTSDEEINRLFGELLDITETIPGVEDYVVGPNNSPESMNEGFTHGFVMTFTDAAARDAYLPHPEHERVKANFMAHLDKVVILDFEV